MMGCEQKIALESGSVDPSDKLTRPYRFQRRPKSAGISSLKRYLIGCAHLLYARADPRRRDEKQNLIPPEPFEKLCRPSSDLTHQELTTLYFGVHKSIISQSKSRVHQFAPPNWSLMEEYLFPWIC